MLVNLVKKVLKAEINGGDSHSITNAEFADLNLKDALFCAYPLWEMRQLEILDGIPHSDSELLKTNIDELKEIVYADKNLILEDHDAYAGLKERYK